LFSRRKMESSTGKSHRNPKPVATLSQGGGFQPMVRA
jgi:hypothetical protein